MTVASISAICHRAFNCDMSVSTGGFLAGLEGAAAPLPWLAIGVDGCSTVVLAASAAIAAWVWGILPPAKHSLGVLMLSFDGFLDMPVVHRLSN